MKGRDGLDPSNHNILTYTGHKVFIRKETRTCINPRVTRVSLFIASVSTPTLKPSHKSTTVGTHRGAHEIKLHENNDIPIYNQVSSRLQVVSGFSRVFD
jgi:hypothetical protein